jgi:hypothetical protein
MFTGLCRDRKASIRRYEGFYQNNLKLPGGISKLGHFRRQYWRIKLKALKHVEKEANAEAKDRA